MNQPVRQSEDQYARPRVLVVEDEQDLAEVLSHHLDREGFGVLWAGSGEQALAAVDNELPDLILLDLMLPGLGGLEVCRRLKADAATATIPILMVTARGDESDVVSGLELGADDYIVKPFSPRVLMARVRAVMRRQKTTEPSESTDTLIQRGMLALDSERHEARLDGKLLELTATEFRLLLLLARRPGRVFTRNEIIDAIHGSQSAVTDRSVDVQVVSLRRKLGDAGHLIQTVRGVGYRFGES
jgi:two-component system phosphate regulon response regulator PhoB